MSRKVNFIVKKDIAQEHCKTRHKMKFVWVVNDKTVDKLFKTRTKWTLSYQKLVEHVHLDANCFDVSDHF